MGIDRWKQEHRNWRPGGTRLMPSEPDEPLPTALSSEKTPSATRRAAKKQAGPSASNAASASKEAQPKQRKR
jgi:hypothetical protein